MSTGRLSLFPRIAAAAILIPLALAAAWYGPETLALLTFAAGIAMAREWARLVAGALTAWPFWVCALGLTVSQGLMSANLPDMAWMAVFAAGCLGAVAARAQGTSTFPIFLGILIIAGACLGLVWLRALPVFGLETVFFLFAIVWATDTAAFAAGAAMGGPKLAPAISPMKTWAGAIAAVAAAAAAAYAYGLFLKAPDPLWFVALGTSICVVSQLGDLIESGVKRRFGVKDMSDLIPGHGGALDRLDGLIAATIFLCLLTIWGGASPLLWR